MEKCTLLLDSPARNFTEVIHQVVDSCGLSEKVKAALRKNLLLRDQNLTKKSFKFGAALEDLVHDKAKTDKLKEENEKLLLMAGKDKQISGKGATDQVTVGDKIKSQVLLILIFS